MTKDPYYRRIVLGLLLTILAVQPGHAQSGPWFIANTIISVLLGLAAMWMFALALLGRDEKR